MKKLIAVLTALMICAGCFGAVAENAPAAQDMPVAGLSFTCPAAMAETKGLVRTDGAMNLFNSVYVTYWYYAAVSEEEFADLSVNDPDQLQEKLALLFYVFSVGEGKDFASVCEMLNMYTGMEFSADNAAEIGQADAWKFYLYMNADPEFAGTAGDEYGSEYTALAGLKDELVSAFDCYVPFNEYGEMDGRVIRFEVTDLEGNVISSEDLFAQHEITMVNIWATWCGPCVGELGELQAIHTRFLEKDCAVLGLMTDGNTEEANRLIAENGITYQVVNTPELFNSIFPFEAIPTTFFVDRSGAFLGTKIQGADPEMYETAIQPLLEQVQQANP